MGTVLARLSKEYLHGTGDWVDKAKRPFAVFAHQSTLNQTLRLIIWRVLAVNNVVQPKVPCTTEHFALRGKTVRQEA